MEDNDETDRMIFKVIYVFRKILEQRAVNRHLHTESWLNITHVPYIMNIGTNGISNTDLVFQMKVSRQAVSKILKEMEHEQLIYTSKNENDARTLLINLAPKGKALFNTVRVDAKELSGEYKKILGPKKYETMVDSLLEIVAYHESLEKK